MGYSAHVACNCYKEGKTTKPPYEEYMVWDEEEGTYYLEIPHVIWRRDEKKYYQMMDEFDEWKLTACAHKDLLLCDEFLTNSLGMGDFRFIIKDLGGQKKFPVLTKFLPQYNGGILPAEYAKDAYQELLELEKSKTKEKKMILIEKELNELIVTVNADTFVIFIFTANHNYGLDKDGFFILENVKENDEEVSYVVFRSMNFYQQKITEEQYAFIDKETDEVFYAPVSIAPLSEKDEERDFEFVVKKEVVSVSDEFKYIIEPLKRLTKASMKSGNSIHWT